MIINKDNLLDDIKRQFEEQLTEEHINKINKIIAEALSSME